MCPSCHQGALLYTELEKGLRCQRCKHCGGNWILLSDYIEWLEQDPQIEKTPLLPLSPTHITELEENKKALLCPVSGQLMIKFRASNNTSLRLDYSAAAKGIWLEKGMWEHIKHEELAKQLNQIITDSWQNKMIEQASRDAIKTQYLRRFGEENYERIKEFRTWLHTQKSRSEVLEYLTAKDPYDSGN